MDLVCPEEAQPCKDFMKDFLFRLVLRHYRYTPCLPFLHAVTLCTTGLREQKEQESQSGSFQDCSSDSCSK